jgi:uncharacterized protein YjbI with pentapeptide repeats
LIGCNFTESNLSFADFYMASLANSRFAAANLKSCDLTSANLKGSPRTLFAATHLGAYQRSDHPAQWEFWTLHEGLGR